MYIKLLPGAGFLKICIAVVLLAFALVGCSRDGLLISAHGYIDYYDAVARDLGFEDQAKVVEDGNTKGFSAFDGIFTVCLITNGDGEIIYAEISTSEDFKYAVEDEDDLTKEIMWASYLAMPFYRPKDCSEFSQTDVSTVSGMLLASFEQEVDFEGMVCSSKWLDCGFVCTFTVN